MAAHQAPLSLWFSRQEYWNGLPFPSPMHTCMLSRFSCVRLCVTLWRTAHQAHPYTGFSRQEYWSVLPFPSPGLPYDSVIPCLSIYLKKMKTLIRKSACTLMFISALFFSIAKIWKQPKCPSIKVRCIYISEYYSTMKNSEILPFAATWMYLDGIMLKVK